MEFSAEESPRDLCDASETVGKFSDCGLESFRPKLWSKPDQQHAGGAQSGHPTPRLPTAFASESGRSTSHVPGLPTVRAAAGTRAGGSRPAESGRRVLGGGKETLTCRGLGFTTD